MKQFIKTNLIFLILLALDGLVVTAHYLLKNKYGFFDLDGEGNLNSAYSGLKLLFIGGLILFQFLIFYKIKDKFKKRLVWLLTAVSFIYLGIDEMMAIHERTGFVFNNLLGVSNSAGASFNWIIYFSSRILEISLEHLLLRFSMYFTVLQPITVHFLPSLICWTQ